MVDELETLLTAASADLVRRYYVTFPGRWFDITPDTDPYRFTLTDVAALAVLDVNIPSWSIEALLTDVEFGRLLRELPLNLGLAQSDSKDVEPAEEMWQRLRSLKGIGRTKTSKLLARKRPHLIPVYDRVVDRALGLRSSPDGWSYFRTQLNRPQLVDAIRGLRESAQVPAAVSDLRLLDVAIWTTHR